MAARFPDRRRASAALDALQQRLQLTDGDAAIAPLGIPGESATGDQTLLAGHFPDEQNGLVRSLVARSGGEVVADVDEQWTRPRSEYVSPVADSTDVGVTRFDEGVDRRPFRHDRRASGHVRQPMIQ